MALVTHYDFETPLEVMWARISANWEMHRSSEMTGSKIAIWSEIENEI